MVDKVAGLTLASHVKHVLAYMALWAFTFAFVTFLVKYVLRLRPTHPGSAGSGSASDKKPAALGGKRRDTKMSELRENQLALANRVVSMLHACVSSYLGYRAVTLGTELAGGDWRSLLGADSDLPQYDTALACSLGYFLYDFTYSVATGTEGGVMLFHHLLSLSGMGFGLFFQRSAWELCACLTLSEVSNPFLHLRSVLMLLDRGSSLLGWLNERAFFFVFTAARVFYGPVLTWNTMLHPRVIIFPVRIGAALMQGVSFYWFIEIMRHVIDPKRRQKLGRGKGNE